MPVSEAFEAKLGEAVLAHQEYESPRNFGLEFFGITEEEVSAELHDVFEEFGYTQPAHTQYLEAAE